MNDKIVKRVLFAIGGAVSLVFSVFAGKAAVSSYKEFCDNRRKKYLEEQHNISDFNESKRKFRVDYSEAHISSLTLSNPKIKNNSERSYLYDKLRSLKNDAIDCGYNRRDDYNYYVNECIDLEYVLTNLDPEAINAKLESMHGQDEIDQKEFEKDEAFYAAENAHKKELELIEAKRKADLDIYKAKLNVEQAKLKTICETMSNSSNKNVNSTLNIKTDISED
jgi:hypothetical protein